MTQPVCGVFGGSSVAVQWLVVYTRRPLVRSGPTGTAFARVRGFDSLVPVHTIPSHHYAVWIHDKWRKCQAILYLCSSGQRINIFSKRLMGLPKGSIWSLTKRWPFIFAINQNKGFFKICQICFNTRCFWIPISDYWKEALQILDRKSRQNHCDIWK